MNKENSKLLLNAEIERTKQELKKERTECNSINIFLTFCGVSLGTATTATAMFFALNAVTPIALSVGAALGGSIGCMLGVLGIDKENKKDLKSDLMILKELKSSLETSQNNIFENVEEAEFSETLGKYGHSKYRALSKKK